MLLPRNLLLFSNASAEIFNFGAIMREFYSENTADTERIAAEIAKPLANGGFLALYGEMGAGKTAFVRGLVKALCPECLELVHSPTFAIVNVYEGKTITVKHFDLYRITDEDDLYSTGFYDSEGESTLIVTEWSELFEDSIPENAAKIKLERLADGRRRIYELC